MIKHPDTDYIDPLDLELKEHPVHCSHVESQPNGLPWYFDIKRYLESRHIKKMLHLIRRSRYVVWLSISFWMEKSCIFGSFKMCGCCWSCEAYWTDTCWSLRYTHEWAYFRKKGSSSRLFSVWLWRMTIANLCKNATNVMCMAIWYRYHLTNLTPWVHLGPL